MSKSKRDGLYLLGLGVAVFLLFGLFLQHSAGDAHEDFKAVDYGARCLLHHCDPYNESELFRYYQQEFPEPIASHLRSHTLTLYINLPATLLLVAPFAMLPFALASLVWSILTAASLILAAFLMWDLASIYAPVLAGALIALSLASCAIVLGNGNPAGMVVAFALIAVWCFIRERFVLAGILCLSVSLAVKPHDAGLVWLCLLLMGGSIRKRALLTLAATALISASAVLWVSTVAPHWLPELRASFAQTAAPGYNNNPGPAGATSRDRAIEMIVSLQSAISLFSDNSLFYNGVTYVICGMLFLFWLFAALRSHGPPPLTFIALAVITPITLLVTYHRAYDARLLMLTVPACAMLYAEGKSTGKIALVITALGLIFTGELPYALLKPLTSDSSTAHAGIFESVPALLLDHSAPMFLLLLAVFYTSIYVRRSSLGSAQPSCPPLPDANAIELPQNHQA